MLLRLETETTTLGLSATLATGRYIPVQSYARVCKTVRMQPHQQQQTVITQPVAVHPTYVNQPYIVESYRHVHANIIGILLIVAGAVNILFSIIEIVFSSSYFYYYYYYSYYYGYSGVSGWGVVCGAMVSMFLIESSE